MLFSVIIPVYNRAEKIKRTLDSVLQQRLRDFEVIVVDDGSTEANKERMMAYIEGLNDARIRVAFHPQNKNGAAARNTGIDLAVGELVCFLDSDDEWHENKLEKVLAEFRKQESTKVFLFHQYFNSVNGMMSEPLPVTRISEGESVGHFLFVTNNFGGILSSNICVPRELAKSVRFNEDLRGYQDWDFSLRCGEQVDKICFIGEPLTIRHYDSADSVARSLDWRYCYRFFKLYQSYIEGKVERYYLDRVLIKKAYDIGDEYKLLCTSIFWKHAILRPLWLYSQFKKYQKVKADMKKRLLSLSNMVREKGVRTMAIWGVNDYSKAIIESMTEAKVEIVLDNQKAEYLEYFHGVPVIAPSKLPAAMFDNLDIIVMATDRHHHSMRATLAAINNSQLKKLIKF